MKYIAYTFKSDREVQSKACDTRAEAALELFSMLPNTHKSVETAEAVFNGYNWRTYGQNIQAITCTQADDYARASVDRYLVRVEELDTYANTTKRYYMRDADDMSKPAIFSKTVAQHCVANMGSDFRYRRHAVAVRVENADPIEDL